MTTRQLDLLTLGESMWRLAPAGVERLVTARNLEIQIGGAESNIAIALARLGMRVAWWSRLPRNALAENVLRVLRGHGVDVSGVVLDPDEDARLGTYFIEFGSAPRPTRVIYDRARSAASKMQPDDFDWTALQHTRHLHLSGITPALSASCQATVRRAVEEACVAGTHVTLDLNYRQKLWSWDACRPVVDDLAKKSDLVISAARDARKLLQVQEEAESLARRLCDRWRRPTVVITQGAEPTVAYDGSHLHCAPAFPLVAPVDRIGAGDAFAAGLHCALLEESDLSAALRYGNAVAALKLSIPGDVALVNRAEVNELLAAGSGEVQR
ncbi:MAG: sugar kinase [Anaerolineaceae bacterium]|nr:sugar kinase [Anaerolineaceae bacterium]